MSACIGSTAYEPGTVDSKDVEDQVAATDGKFRGFMSHPPEAHTAASRRIQFRFDVRICEVQKAKGISGFFL